MTQGPSRSLELLFKKSRVLGLLGNPNPTPAELHRVDQDQPVQRRHTGYGCSDQGPWSQAHALQLRVKVGARKGAFLGFLMRPVRSHGAIYFSLQSEEKTRNRFSTGETVAASGSGIFS